MRVHDRTLTPEEAAGALVRGVERGAPRITTPPLLRLTLWFQRLWPGAVSSLVVRTGVRRPPRPSQLPGRGP